MIELLLVDDHAIFRSGLSRLLSDEPDLRVTGEACNGPEALEQLHRHHFDLILLDINLQGRSGLEILEHIRSLRPQQAVLMLSMYPGDQYALMALQAGAQGYVSKDMDAADLLAAIRVTARGGRYLSPQAMGAVLRTLDQPAGSTPPHHRLSARERQILLLIVRGVSLTEIGQQMCLSVKTVSTYRSRLLQKLGVSSNAALVKYALKYQLAE
ncbi:MAG: hypothetical protein RIR00_814 [Pseudomonadota bacterium]